MGERDAATVSAPLDDTVNGLTTQTSELVLPVCDEYVPWAHGTQRLASFPADVWKH